MRFTAVLGRSERSELSQMEAAELLGISERTFRRFHVRRLDVFGSAARGTDFDPSRSDVDLLVSYPPEHSRDFGEYLALRDALADVLGRPVDLVMDGAVENPFIRAGIERSRQALYGA